LGGKIAVLQALLLDEHSFDTDTLFHDGALGVFIKGLILPALGPNRGGAKGPDYAINTMLVWGQVWG